MTDKPTATTEPPWGWKQPDLVDEFGCQFYGRAKTSTGGVWWYEKDGRRYALRPAHPTIVPTEALRDDHDG